MATPQFKYLKPEDIRALTSYEFAPRAVAEGYLAGRHRARSAGSSVDFRDYRQFVFGDDPALVDWRVYARTDRRYLRTYEQETELECHVFLDSSASMGFGRALTKLEYSSFFCAALSYLVVHNNDRVSLQIFDNQIRNFYPPGSTRRHLHNLLNALERNTPGGQTSLAHALRRSYPLLKRKGSLVIISDFFDDATDIFSALGPYLHRGFKVYLFHVLTPEELDLESRGLVTFQDLESNERVIAHTEDLRPAYGKAMEAHIHALRTLATRRQIDYVLARTDTHYFSLFDHLIQ